MFSIYASLTLTIVASVLPAADAHIALFHPSMWGFNVTDKTFAYDNRPVSPLMNYTFEQWWFHGHLDYPPNPGDVFELPAGQPATTELACNKGATSYFASSEGSTDERGTENSPCPGEPISEFHTNGPNDLFGCALAITYESDVDQVKPEDFTVFSVNQTCVWTRLTDFQVPARMPACPPGGCICAWFWIHSPDSGGEQNYMNGFRCNVTGATSDVALAKPQIPRRCGADPENGKMQAAPGNCTYGAKQPFYWFQNQTNNMFEGTYAPPRYLDMYNFRDGAQDDIFLDSYPSGLPPPSPNSTFVPTPFVGSPVAAPTSPASDTSSQVVPSASGSGGSSMSGSTSSPSGPASSSESISVSASVAAATVTSTAVVTVTVSPSTVSSSLSSSPTATVFSTVIVTVVASDTDAPLVTSSPSVASTVYSTVYAYVTATVDPGDALASAAPGNHTRPVELAELEQVTPNQVESSSSSSGSSQSSAPTSTPSSAFNSQKMCKRQSSPNSGSLQRRSWSLFSLPGSRSHRRLNKKSSLWNIF